MQLNADFDQRAVVHAAREPWLASPMAGVDRRMLDRIGDEVARATSIVRYAPGSHFSPHTHHGGEEFLVLEGVFQDEHGDYPKGSYVRNPPTSRHTPGSAGGCVIFVKLWQFDPEDRTEVRLRADQMEPQPEGDRPGVSSVNLYEDSRETVRIEEWEADQSVDLKPVGGCELLVIDGSMTEGDELFGPQSWLRLPPGMALSARAGGSGASVWIKTGHLLKITVPG